jgi:hypothetical protein
MADEERIIDPSPLNERQEELIQQVKKGEIKESEPDTEAQLLTLARMGHLDLDSDEDGYHFSVPPAKRSPRAK